MALSCLRIDWSNNGIRIRKTKGKFFFCVLTGICFLFLMTFVFEFVSKRCWSSFLASRTDQSNIQVPFNQLWPAVFALHHGRFVEEFLFPSALVTSLAETSVSWLSIILLVGLVFCSWLIHILWLYQSGSVQSVTIEWRHCLFIIYVRKKKKAYLLSL